MLTLDTVEDYLCIYNPYVSYTSNHQIATTNSIYKILLLHVKTLGRTKKYPTNLSNQLAQ